jgi:hypothetical protein
MHLLSSWEPSCETLLLLGFSIGWGTTWRQVRPWTSRNCDKGWGWGVGRGLPIITETPGDQIISVW